MVFYCKACSAALQKEDIDFETGIASCSHCQAVMSFAQEMGLRPKAPPPPPQHVEPVRPWAPKPASIQVSDTPLSLQFTRRWFNGTFIFLVFFCIAWDAFLIFWYTMAGTIGPSGGPGLFFLLFPLVHVAVGVGLTYYTIAGFVNRTVIDVNDNHVSIRHQPLPWRGNCELSSSDLKQLYCERKVSHSKNGTSITYRLNAILKNGEKHQLITGLPDQDTAIYLEQQIEKRLGIKDERVAGEVI